MKLLITYLKPFRKLLLVALFLAAINQIFSLLDPYVMGHYIIDPFAKNAQAYAGKQAVFIAGITKGLLLLISVAMVSRIAKAFQDYTLNVVIQKFGAALYTDGLKHALRLPFGEFEDQRSGETLSILQKVRTDCEKLISALVNILFTTLVGIVFVMIYAITLNSWLVVVYLGGAFLLGWLTNLLSKKIKNIQKRIVKETTALAGATTESLRNIELIKSLGLTQQEVKRLNGNTIKILQLELDKVKSIRTISFVQGTFVNFIRQCIMFALLYFVFKGYLTLGQMITMQFYSFFIFGPLQELGNIILAYREAQASLSNFDALMNKPVEAKPLSPIALGEIHNLQFDQVSFQHKTAKQAALNSISFSVEKGKTIAFVGPSGSGKTTLVKLLVGLYTPIKGDVLYNQLSHTSIDFEELRHQIGLVTQDTQLFAGTIKENLAFVAPNATEEEMLIALEKASCKNILDKGGDGLATLIGEGGLKLSGGEKQRLSIARALLRHPHLLIFDEATSSLDSLTEESITDTIRKLSAERAQITIMIAHRLSTIIHATKIYVLEKGQIIEKGTHESLLLEKGLYYAMWRQQIGERRAAV